MPPIPVTDPVAFLGNISETVVKIFALQAWCADAAIPMTITASHIDVVGRVPGADAATFQKYAEAAEKGCPVSKVLNAKITMNARLES